MDQDSEESSEDESPPNFGGIRSRRASKLFGEDLGAIIAPPPNETIQLPTRWNKDDRSPHLSISADGRDVTYTGKYNDNGQEFVRSTSGAEADVRLLLSRVIWRQ